MSAHPIEPSSISIRLPRLGDNDRIAALLGTLGYPSSHDCVGLRLEHLTDNSSVAVLLADADDVLVGLTTVHVISVIHADGPVAILTALVVDPDYRRRGIGRRLVDAAERWARGHNAQRITVASGLARSDAHLFYELSGYVHSARWYSRVL